MTKYALWQQLASFPAQYDRQLPAGLWPIPGRLTGMLVTVGTGRVVNIAAGEFVVPLGGGQGSVLCISDAADTATFAAAPGSGSNRIDLLCLQVRDATLDAGSNNDWIFSIVQGTPAASPTPPAVPARALALAAVTSVGGQANLAQANIVQQNERVMTGNAGSGVALGVNTNTLLMTTPTLAPGLWDVRWQMLATPGAASGPCGLYTYAQTNAAGDGTWFPGNGVGNASSFIHGITEPADGSSWAATFVNATLQVLNPAGTIIKFYGMATGAGGGTMNPTGAFSLASTGWAVRAVG